MAKITHLPGQAVIDGLKGTLDYYLWMGIACVRSWPSSPGHDRAPAVEAQWSAFSRAAMLWNYLDPQVKEAFNEMAVGTRLTGRDVFTKSYITSKNIHL